MVNRQDMKNASLAVKPWASLYKGARPPLPSPSEVLGFPLSLGWFFSVMAKARTAQARRRAARMMLEDAGFANDEADEMARRMYPDE